MGFFGALGGALKAPLKPINRAVSKVPGMGGLVRSTPGLGAGSASQGIGPSNPALSKFGMLGQQMGQQSPVQVPPPPMDEGYQAPSPPPGMGASPDVMPQTGGEVPVNQGGVISQGASVGQGLGPRMNPRMMQRRPPRMMGRM
jgi:hypothetical protein